MDSGQCLERQQRHHATHAGRTEDGVQSPHNDVGEDAGCLNVSGTGIDDYCVPRSPYAPMFDVASPSIAGFPGILSFSRLRLRFMDGPGGLCDAAYWPELDECTRLEYRGTSAPRDCKNSLLQLKQARLQKSSKQAGRNVDVQGTDEMTAAEQHFGHRDDKSDAKRYARNSESCGNAQLDPPAVEYDLWEDLHGVHHCPVVSLRNRVHNEVSHGSYHCGLGSTSGHRRGRAASPPSATTKPGSDVAAACAVRKGTLVGSPTGPAPHRVSSQAPLWAFALEPFTVDASGTKSSTERLQELTQEGADVDLAAGTRLAMMSLALRSGLVWALTQL